ncbi:RIO1 family regulatory kinase/ATPase domain-containing protein [Vallitalea longa]|nr:RIO1 family regulatory kinase/ATPase [Vallitalea longa]
MNYELMKTFKSRKNKVELIYDIDNGMKLVRKEYLNLEHCKKKETSILRILEKHNVKVPRIIYENNNMIYMTYISDVTLLDYFLLIENDIVIDKDKAIIDIFKKVFSWLEQYYQITFEYMGRRLIFYDINFRNFLIKDDIIYGIDFEDSISGSKEIDGGRFCAYLLTYKPILTEWKINITAKVIDLLVDDFKYDRKSLLNEIKKELDKINFRRWDGHRTSKVKYIISLLDSYAE